jgi:hypothetical protein
MMSSDAFATAAESFKGMGGSVMRGGYQAGTYTRPLLGSMSHTFCGLRWVASVCQRQKRLRLS